MRVLVIKTSSLGDVIHTLPALTDAARNLPGVRFDWVVEEAFAQIPTWHPAVDRVIPVALRRWRRAPLQAWRSGEWKRFYGALRSRRYDCIIDAQGLLKSALITAMTRGPSHGLDRRSAREPLASVAYRNALTVERGLHAITRVRKLFAAVFGYALTDVEMDYGIERSRLKTALDTAPRIVFLHGTTWPSKHYPESHWRELVRRVAAAGYRVILPWGSEAELARAQRLAAESEQADVWDKTDLSGVAGLLASAHGVVAVDTGLAHLASALQVPGVFLYGPTDIQLTGVMGKGQKTFQQQLDCVPCLKKNCAHPESEKGVPVCLSQLAPDRVFDALQGSLQAHKLT